MSYTLSEHESKQILRSAGIPVPEDALVDTTDEAVRAAERLGYPVALKLCGRKIAHKTERGLVRLVMTRGGARRSRALLAARRATTARQSSSSAAWSADAGS
jgi:acetyl-CoA synthetase (ADP-forming)